MLSRSRGAKNDKICSQKSFISLRQTTLTNVDISDKPRVAVWRTAPSWTPCLSWPGSPPTYWRLTDITSPRRLSVLLRYYKWGITDNKHPSEFLYSLLWINWEMMWLNLKIYWLLNVTVSTNNQIIILFLHNLATKYVLILSLFSSYNLLGWDFSSVQHFPVFCWSLASGSHWLRSCYWKHLEHLQH